MVNETNELLKQLETENNGKLVYKTYALFRGKSGKGVRNLGGLFYVVNDLLVFEDFERQGGMLQFFIKKKEKYEKTKFSFALNTIKNIDTITRSAAVKAVRYKTNPVTIKPANGIMKIINRTTTQILMQDGSAYYFELFDEKNFKSFIAL